MAEEGFVMNRTGGLRKVVLCPSTCFHCRLIYEIARGIALCAKRQVPELLLGMLKKRRFELIEVAGEGRVLTSAGNAAVKARLDVRGPEVITPGLTQILKGGGGPHCSTHPLLRYA
jgi:N-dimethylarginine dimethylaminohydrolase